VFPCINTTAEQVQRFEASDYAAASLDTLLEVSRAVEIDPARARASPMDRRDPPTEAADCILTLMLEPTEPQAQLPWHEDERGYAIFARRPGQGERRPPRQRELDGIARCHRKYWDTDGKDGRQAVLPGARLTGLNVAERDLSEASLADPDLSQADLRCATFDRCGAAGTDLSRAEPDGASALKADLREARLIDAGLEGGKFAEADLSVVEGLAARCSGADFCDATLTWASFRAADFSNADFTWARAWRVQLDRALLQGTDLRHATLSGAGLYRADLRGADLRGTVLSSACAREADLRGADLSGARIEGARTEGVDWSRAHVPPGPFRPVPVPERSPEEPERQL